jgi:hypothetical protein
MSAITGRFPVLDEGAGHWQLTTDFHH